MSKPIPNPRNWHICGHDPLTGAPVYYSIEEWLSGGKGMVIADHIPDLITAKLIVNGCKLLARERDDQQWLEDIAVTDEATR